MRGDNGGRERHGDSPTAGSGATPEPPAGSGIVVEETGRGTRITLPRLYTTGDIIITGLSAAITVWMVVWLDAVSGADSAASALGRAVMVAIALFFGLLALSQGLPIATRRFIEGRGDRLLFGRSLGARRLVRREVPRSAIRMVDRVRDAEPEVGAGPEEVRVWTDDGEHRFGKQLDDDAVAWLEDAVRRLAGR